MWYLVSSFLLCSEPYLIFVYSGLALLQSNSQFPESYEDCMEAPAFHLQEAAMLHKFAEAAYTVRLNNTGSEALL